jgi:SAM-dependent methyltransferase
VLAFDRNVGRASSRKARQSMGDFRISTESDPMSPYEDSSGTPDLDLSIAPPPAEPWESAYLRFETPQQEIQKFVDRLKRLGAPQWSRDARVVELFCGRGNGLHALQRLGFHNIEGVDLSPRLIAQYHGRAKCYVLDCRRLPFADESKDAVIVQGGLHHLASLPSDLEQTFAEIRRVLKQDGRVLLVEPWLTPFLRLVHAIGQNALARRLSKKLDALATMIDYERPTYENWLGRPAEIRSLAHQYFVPQHESFRWGKWNFVGKPR